MSNVRLVVDWEAMIFEEIRNPKIPRRSIAQTYAYLIMTGHKDWKPINQAILGRYKMSGLIWIKEQAWKRVRAERANAP
jgi:hypothetical protein